ncbi:hypothetical protein HY991_02215 [Candidatus Micrarchaeota archaeon]|nr:hypothetical protein [Candidatus Micrarchaeota archaeon]
MAVYKEGTTEVEQQSTQGYGYVYLLFFTATAVLFMGGVLISIFLFFLLVALYYQSAKRGPPSVKEKITEISV